ncbi:hypothetical protein [Novosphingobium sp. P6W]|uniref:hypothetical protein n=1 Tax=Novosphingobium sp. P6W TaxID=1609758 RepID=UPI0013B4289F|nr:hypothetical protein [Novosphingobium sp. P6W]
MADDIDVPEGCERLGRAHQLRVDITIALTGVGHLYGGEQQRARRVVRFCRRIGLDARIAIAGTLVRRMRLRVRGHGV